MPPTSHLEASRDRSRLIVASVVYALVGGLLWVIRTT